MVLEVHMPHQFHLEVREPEVERAPGAAGLFRRHEVLRERAHALEVGRVVFMFGLHDANRRVGISSASGAQHREENLLLLLHVLLEFFAHRRDECREAIRAARFVAVHGFDSLGHLDEAHDLLPMPVVVLSDDEVDELGQRLVLPAARRGVAIAVTIDLGAQLAEDLLEVQALLRAGVLQRDGAVAAEVEAIAVEDARRARVARRQVC